ncbi:MAG: sugar phosphate isomerase/epimerase [Acidobacteriaceae bacterium]|nr:sugar phosphate isomerase/epimerase [Acidobacteriaceae bacterium]
MPTYDRRTFTKAALATVASARWNTAAGAPGVPRLGVVVGVSATTTPEQAIAKVHRLAFPTCQLAVGTAPLALAAPIREALTKYQVEATALMTLGEGRMVWNLREGPLTIGIIPPATRRARIDALKRASDLAKACGVKAVHTHCGFIPEGPNEPLYADAVAAITEVAGYCRSNGQTFLMETGQETPITLLRAIEDVGLDNLGVNLDVANLILYGKGEPVGALDVIGPYVRGLHAKDGLYPTDPYGLGREVPIGKGRVRFAEVIAGLRRISYTGPITIEREITGPKQERDIIASKLYLEQLINREYRGT